MFGFCNVVMYKIFLKPCTDGFPELVESCLSRCYCSKPTASAGQQVPVVLQQEFVKSASATMRLATGVLTTLPASKLGAAGVCLTGAGQASAGMCPFKPLQQHGEGHVSGEDQRAPGQGIIHGRPFDGNLWAKSSK